ncbi:hypothetical protein GWI33_015031 [Rhynchophorus ferrugineus]|uniref:Uncharacterized protein n=1 Tax=Rhynchophorus ferrugineus TaxID=354439 RepID=A0A834I0I4_RHYFE|nr:hypothetical protein GWI33_015031 [Rhynchophorus ferrugineus]
MEISTEQSILHISRKTNPPPIHISPFAPPAPKSGERERETVDSSLLPPHPLSYSEPRPVMAGLAMQKRMHVSRNRYVPWDKVWGPSAFERFSFNLINVTAHPWALAAYRYLRIHEPENWIRRERGTGVGGRSGISEGWQECIEMSASVLPGAVRK